jgi:hypothetical protein
VGTINNGKIVSTSPSFECGLFGILGAFDALFEVVLKTVPVCDVDVGVYFAKILV